MFVIRKILRALPEDSSARSRTVVALERKKGRDMLYSRSRFQPALFDHTVGRAGVRDVERARRRERASSGSYSDESNGFQLFKIPCKYSRHSARGGRCQVQSERFLTLSACKSRIPVISGVPRGLSSVSEREKQKEKRKKRNKTRRDVYLYFLRASFSRERETNRSSRALREFLIGIVNSQVRHLSLPSATRLYRSN